MNIYQRYKKMTIWNKLAAWGSVITIGGFIVTPFIKPPQISAGSSQAMTFSPGGVQVGRDLIINPPSTAVAANDKHEVNNIDKIRLTINKKRKLVVGQDWNEDSIKFYIKLKSMHQNNYYEVPGKKNTYNANIEIQTPESKLFDTDVYDKKEMIFDYNQIQYKIILQHEVTNDREITVTLYNL